MHRENETMYVSGKFHAYTTGDAVDCADFDAIAPLTDLIHRIVELSDYDGFGCINFKFAPNKYVVMVKSSSVNNFYVPT